MISWFCWIRNQDLVADFVAGAIQTCEILGLLLHVRLMIYNQLYIYILHIHNNIYIYTYPRFVDVGWVFGCAPYPFFLGWWIFTPGGSTNLSVRHNASCLQKAKSWQSSQFFCRVRMGWSLVFPFYSHMHISIPMKNHLVGLTSLKSPWNPVYHH